jgi:hypothetical protein
MTIGVFMSDTPFASFVLDSIDQFGSHGFMVIDDDRHLSHAWLK